ncbi:MAG: DUF4249 domain-containing protein [Saprospiraceae bacterium]
MLRTFAAIALLATGLTACSPDFFDQVIDIDPPPHTPKITTFATLTNLDSTTNVSVTRSFGLLEQKPDSAYYLRNAMVRITENGALWADLKESRPSIGAIAYVSMQNKTPQPGRTYEIIISHPELGQASAVQTMPGPVKVTKTEAQANGGLGAFGDRFSAVYATIDDPPGEKNYYALGVSRVYFELYPIFDANFNIIGYDTIGYSLQREWMEGSNDPAGLLGTNGEILFSDELFDGQSYRLSGRFYNYDQDPGALVQIHVRHVTPEYYRFSVTEQRRVNAEDFPLAEPVTVFYNLQNGIGIFRMAYEQSFMTALK